MHRGPQFLSSKFRLMTSRRLILGLSLDAFCCLPGFEGRSPWS